MRGRVGGAIYRITAAQHSSIKCIPLVRASLPLYVYMCPFFWSKPYYRLLSEKHLTISPCNNLLSLIKFPITIAELLIRSKYKIHCLERSVVSFFCFADYSHYNQIFQVKMHLNNKTLFLFRKDSISECT